MRTFVSRLHLTCIIGVKLAEGDERGTLKAIYIGEALSVSDGTELAGHRGRFVSNN